MMLLLGLNVCSFLFVKYGFDTDNLTAFGVGLVLLYTPLTIADEIGKHRSRKRLADAKSNAPTGPHSWMGR